MGVGGVADATLKVEIDEFCRAALAHRDRECPDATKIGQRISGRTRIEAILTRR
jgi:hypothetical protein